MWAQLSILAAVIACGSCAGPSFEAVDAAGKTGSRISDQAEAFDAWLETCETFSLLVPSREALRALGAGTANAACENYKKSIQRIDDVALALAAYGSKLSAVATGSDVAVGNKEYAAIAAVGVSGWTENTTKSKIVSVVVGLYSKAYRKQELNSVIASMNDSVTEAVEECDDAARVADSDLATLQLKLADIRARLAKDAMTALDNGSAVSNSTSLELVALSQLQRNADRAQKATDLLRANVDAFGKAHATLVAHLGELDSAGLHAEVLSVVGRATKNASAVAASRADGKDGSRVR